jgi:hypothetical protein
MATIIAMKYLEKTRMLLEIKGKSGTNWYHFIGTNLAHQNMICATLFFYNSL